MRMVKLEDAGQEWICQDFVSVGLNLRLSFGSCDFVSLVWG
jgi:hypothetical protein